MTSAPDYEMRCASCGTRMFSGRGPELVAEQMPCPRCQGTVELVTHDIPTGSFDVIAGDPLWLRP